ncbi:hypothetical protein [Portibacter marinus]|uniref:hypothetical protein n=1 Tax=Portibacter marinus TaxID=2898660 RepID=UPI001F3487C4|nr:hypothetical protein [Portibacter marinus]
MKFQVVVLLLLFSVMLSAQKVFNVRYPSSTKQISIHPGLHIPTISSGYTLWLPKGAKTNGMIVFLYENRDTLQQDLLLKTAMSNGIAVIFMTTDNPLEFLFEESKTKMLAQDLDRVCTNFSIPKKNLLFAGHSIAGIRAMKLAIYLKQNKIFEPIIPKAIAISDVPLDISRFYGKCEKEFSQELGDYEWAGSFSAMQYLSNHLDGNPSNSKARYASYSPYSRTVRNGGNAGYFLDLYIRAYVDENTDWTSIQHGGNAYDMANFINQLRLLGSDKAILVQSKLPRNTKSSWDLVDERNLVEWFARLCVQKE